jgi:hypothetical protein
MGIFHERSVETTGRNRIDNRPAITKGSMIGRKAYITVRLARTARTDEAMVMARVFISVS